MESVLSIRVTAGDQNHVVYAEGDLDFASGPSLRAVIDGIDADVPTIRVDLDGVQFMDSTGLSVLLAARESLASSSRTLVVSRPTKIARRVIEMCGLTEVLNLTDLDETPARPASG